MKTNLFFDFQVNKNEKQIVIIREFEADREIVWNCFTKKELLEKWFAPKPWHAKTKTMEFKKGGFWLYAMCGPNGEEHWGKMEYFNINPIESYEGLDKFCDENGIQNMDLPSQYWNVNFQVKNDITLVKIIISYKSLEDLEALIKMGMKEGLTMTLKNLDEIILELNKKNMQKITVVSTINSDVKKVWDYYTKPIHITKWNFASSDWCCPKVENELKIGGVYKARMEAKDGSFGFDFEGTYNNIISEKSINYTLLDNRNVSVEFEQNNYKTIIKIVFDAENENPIDLQKVGWQLILDNFKKYTETN
ncbi:MAG: SRPBCC family protein [Candidatus Kapaibacterium sp.]